MSIPHRNLAWIVGLTLLTSAVGDPCEAGRGGGLFGSGGSRFNSGSGGLRQATGGGYAASPSRSPSFQRGDMLGAGSVGLRFDGTIPRASVGQGAAFDGVHFNPVNVLPDSGFQGVQTQTGDWYHGSWHGNWSAANDSAWPSRLSARYPGSTLFASNRLANQFGYYGAYDNPYYDASTEAPGGFSYDEPLMAPDSTGNLMDPGSEAAPEGDAGEGTVLRVNASRAGMVVFNAARGAFYDGDLDRALEQVDDSLKSLPNDAAVHEFRALVLFAQGEYRNSAAGIYAVLAAGPGWDWTTLVGLYPSVEVYTTQLRALEAWMKQNVQKPEGHFLLGYHYLTQGHNDAALRRFRHALQLTPADPVVKQYVDMLSGTATEADSTKSGAASAATISDEQIRGVWKASGNRDDSYEFSLLEQNRFEWSYTRDGQTQTVKGKYTLVGGMLTLEPDDGGTMIANITPPENDEFLFRLTGGPENDPGLKFTR